MDWSKTKSYLIIALLATNIILGYFYVSQLGNEDEVEQNIIELDNVVKLLEENNIVIKADLDIPVPTIIGINVEFEQYDLQKISPKFFDTSSLVQKIDNNNHYYDLKYDLKIINKTYLEYELKDYTTLKPDNSIGEEARYYADKFLQYTGFMTAETKFSSVEKENNYYRVEYIQKSGDSLILDSRVVIKVSNKQVIGFTRKWLKNLDEIVVNDKFIGVGKTLYTFLEKIYIDYPAREVRIVIEDISVGYKLVNNSSSVEISNVSSGTIDPYWIIKTNRGDYFIEALEK